MKNFIIVLEDEERFAAAVMSWEGSRSYTRETSSFGICKNGYGASRDWLAYQ